MKQRYVINEDSEINVLMMVEVDKTVSLRNLSELVSLIDLS